MNNYKEFLELTQANAPGSVTEPAERAANAPGPEAEPLGDELPPDYDSLPEPERRRIQSSILGRQAAHLGIDKTLSQARAGQVMPYRPPVPGEYSAPAGFTCSEAVRKCISPGPLPPPPPVSQIEQDRAAFARLAREDAAKNARSKGLEGGKFRHDVIAGLVRDYFGRDNPPGLVFLNNHLHRYDAARGIYVPAESAILQLVNAWTPSAKQKDRQEVINSLRDTADIPAIGPAGDDAGEERLGPRIGLTPAEERRKKYLVPFANGVLDLLTGELAPDFAEFWRYGFVRRIPFDWDPEAYDGATDKALDAYARTDPAVRVKIAELAGFCLYGSNDLKTAFVLYGPSGTGKSTVLDLLTYALGRENVDHTPITELCQRPFSLVNLYGKFASITGEFPSRALAKEDRFKLIVAGDRMTAERKFKTPFRFAPAAKVIIATNIIPLLADDSSGAVENRMQFIELERSITAGQQIPGFAERLKTPAGAGYLLRLGVEAFRERLRRGAWTVTRAEARLRDEFRHNSDPNLQFFDELRPDYVLGLDTGELYQEYTTWCTDSGLPFSQKLTRRTVTDRACKAFGLSLGEQQRGKAGKVQKFRRPD